MVEAQTAKQFQRNGQKYQDDMKDYSNSEVKRKTKKSVKFEIEEDKVIEAHWPCYALAGGARKSMQSSAIAGAEKQGQENYAKSSNRPTPSRLAGV